MPSLPESLSFNELGGEKLDYSTVVDSSTDRSADEVNKVFCNVAQMSRLSPRVWCNISINITGPTATLTNWDAVWKASSPTPPTLTYVTTGTWTLTFPTSVYDEMLNSHYVNLRGAWTSSTAVATNSLASFGTVISSANVITFTTHHSSGGLSNFTCSFDLFAI